MKRKSLVLALVGMALGSNPWLVEAQTKTVALVNDVPILEVELIKALAPYQDQIAGSPTVYLEMRERVLNELIEEQLVLQAAKTKGITIAEAEIDQIINIIKTRFESEEKFNLALETNGLTMAEFRERVKEKLLGQKIKDIELKKQLRLTEQQLNNFCQNYGVKVHAQHILVKTEKEALEVLQKLQSGVDFAQLATQYSLCPSRQVGGDLGFFGRGQMVPEFEEAAFSMNKEGQLSDVVKTKFGYHIIRFITKKDPTPEEIEEIKKALLNELYGLTYLITGEGLNFEIKRNLEEKFIGQDLKLFYTLWLIELKSKAKILKF